MTRTVSVHDSYYPVRTSVDIPYTDDYNPDSYEYRTPFLDTTEMGDVHAQSPEQWEIEEQAYNEDWDSVPDFRDRPVSRRSSKPAPNVDYAEANHLYISAATMALVEMFRIAARRVNYNPPKRRMSTSKTVPIVKKEVPDKVVPQKPKYVGVNKMGRSLRIPLKDLPLYKYRGWKEMSQ